MTDGAAAARETERTMLDRLNVRYSKHNGNGIRYTRAEHVKVTAGWDSRRVCDYMALDLYAGYGVQRGPYLHGHEVKVSRSDWLTELKDPEKAESFARYCDFWWLVIADKAMVKPGELPDGWGLMVPHGPSLRVVTSATRRAVVEPMPRDLQATFSRAVTKTTVRLTAQHDPAVGFLTRRLGLTPATPNQEQ
jgi:hypothetical protein